MSLWLTLVGGVIATAGTGVALGAALGITGLTILQFYSNGATSVAIDAIWNVFNSFTLSAVPMFILLGEILLRSGISEKAYASFAVYPAAFCTPTSLCARCLVRSVGQAFQRLLP